MKPLAYALVFALLAGLSFLLLLVRRVVRHRALVRSLGYQLLLVRVPRDEGASGGDARAQLLAQLAPAEQLFASLLALKETVSYEVAVPHIGEELHFYVSVPREMTEAVTRQVQGLWPAASVTREEGDYNIFSPGGAVSAAYVTVKDGHGLPIRTYQELGSDPTAAILGGFAKLSGVGQGAAFQVLVRPAPKDASKGLQKLLEGLKQGRKLKELLPSIGATLSSLTKTDQPEAPPGKPDEELVKALEGKVAKPLAWVEMRLVASAPSQLEADQVLAGIAAGFAQFAAPRRNELRVTKPRSQKGIVHEFSFREFTGAHASLLNTEELASLYHFPIAGSGVARVKWLKSREAAPPANLPTDGLLLGESVYRGVRTPVYLSDEDRRRHLYVIGQTGTGKSTLLGNLILDDIEHGRGVAVLDPHGDLVETALAHVPPSRIDDVVYFDPGDLMFPLGLNMLEFNPANPEEKTFIVNEVQGIFNKLFPPETMGPMFEQYMRNALLLLMEDAAAEPATLVEVPRVFTDAAWRKRKLDRITNPVVKDFWEQEATKAGGDASLQNMTPYITSKFSNFIANDYVRPIIGQPRSSLNFRELMDNGKILLVNLAKGKIGDINANLLGMIITGRIAMAAFARAGTDAGSRRDFHVYIDEFQNFTTDSISTIFSEARKYRLTLTVAHQFIAQLSDKIRDSVFGNVGNQLAMRVGPTDAEFLVKQFEPVFTAQDLVNIDNLNAYVKVMVQGQTSVPFNMEVGRQSWAKGDPAYTGKLKEYARIKHGTPRHQVEAEITKRLRN